MYLRYNVSPLHNVIQNPFPLLTKKNKERSEEHKTERGIEQGVEWGIERGTERGTGEELNKTKNSKELNEKELSKNYRCMKDFPLPILLPPCVSLQVTIPLMILQSLVNPDKSPKAKNCQHEDSESRTPDKSPSWPRPLTTIPSCPTSQPWGYIHPNIILQQYSR